MAYPLPSAPYAQGIGAGTMPVIYAAPVVAASGADDRAAERDDRAERAERADRAERAERAERADRLAQQAMLQSSQGLQATLASVNATSANVANASIAATGAVASAVVGATRQQIASDGTANQTVVLANGSEYVGHMRAGKPHGSGFLDYKLGTACLLGPPDALLYTLSCPGGVAPSAADLTGADFDGEFRNGTRGGGKGRLRFQGTPLKQYDGDWDDDVPSGRGKLTYRDGSTYIGEFRNGLFWGSGEWERLDNSGTVWFRYNGRFTSGRPDGKGAITISVVSPSGSPETLTAEGDFKDGNMVKGVITFPDSDLRVKYTGDTRGLVPPVPHSVAVKNELIYRNNDKYTGGFVGGARSGTGTMQFATGAVYEGEWAADAMHGKGKLVYGASQAVDVRVARPGRPAKPQNGPDMSYIGDFVADAFDGEGTFRCRTFTYTGGFRAGKLNGTGTRQKFDKYTPSRVRGSPLHTTYDCGRKVSESSSCIIM